MGLSSVFGFTGESTRPWPLVDATTTACWQRWAIRTTSSSSKWLFEAFLHVILFKCFCCWCFWKLRFRVSIWRRDECTASICQQTIRHLGISTFLFLTVRYRYWKWIVYLLYIVPFDSWNRAPIHGVHQDLTHQSYHILDPTPRRNKTLPTICPNL